MKIEETTVESSKVNTTRDILPYEEVDYQHEIYDANLLYKAYKRSRRGNDWKTQVQKFEMNLLINLANIQDGIKNMNYEYLPNTHFVLFERGKERFITGEQINDRIVKHLICDEVLMPAIDKYLVEDNGAGRPGKGTSFTRRKIVEHLRRYYYENKTNEGYVLLIDFSKYYDNIRHDVMMDLFRKYVTDKHVLYLIEKAIEKSRVDVSYMSDDEYENCMNTVFNYLLYQKTIDKSLLTGEKFMDKHLNIGDQISQVAGILYPNRIDQYIKVVRGVKFYARSVDDSYIIHRDKKFLQDILKEIIDIANEIGISVNTKKTRICKLSDQWRFLQIQYSLTETGRIIRKIHPHKIVVMRRKMKKLVHTLSEKEFHDWYYSWYRSNYKVMSRLQREGLNSLFKELSEVSKCTQLNSQMD